MIESNPWEHKWAWLGWSDLYNQDVGWSVSIMMRSEWRIRFDLTWYYQLLVIIILNFGSTISIWFIHLMFLIPIIKLKSCIPLNYCFLTFGCSFLHCLQVLCNGGSQSLFQLFHQKFLSNWLEKLSNSVAVFIFEKKRVWYKENGFRTGMRKI